MNANPLPLSSLSDEELLQHCYLLRPGISALEQELATRLEHLLDELRDGPSGIGDVLTGNLIKSGK